MSNPAYKDLLDTWSVASTKFEAIDFRYESASNIFSQNIIFEDCYSELETTYRPLAEEYYNLLKVFNYNEIDLSAEDISIYKNRLEDFVKKIENVSDNIRDIVYKSKKMGYSEQ